MLEAERQAEQDLIDNCKTAIASPNDTQTDYVLAEPLTEDELHLKEECIKQGFESWSKRDFQQFIKGIEKCGRSVQLPRSKTSNSPASRDDISGITDEVTDKDEQQVAAYAKRFWERWHTLAGITHAPRAHSIA